MAKINFIKGLNFNGDHDVNFNDGCVYPSQKLHFLLSGGIHEKIIFEPMHYGKSCP